MKRMMAPSADMMGADLRVGFGEESELARGGDPGLIGIRSQPGNQCFGCSTLHLHLKRWRIGIRIGLCLEGCLEMKDDTLIVA